MKVNDSKIDKYGWKLIEITKTKYPQEAFTLLGYQMVTVFYATYVDLNNNEFTIHFKGSNKLTYKLQIKKLLMNSNIIEALLSVYSEEELLDRDFLDKIPDSLIMNEDAMNELLSHLDQDKPSIMIFIDKHITIGEYIRERRKRIKEEKQAYLEANKETFDKYDQLKEEFKF